jgi:hypothetical protein
MSAVSFNEKSLVLLFILLPFCIQSATAQDNSAKTATGLHQSVTPDSAKAKKSSLKTGITYNSNSVFLARTDSVATSVFNFGITYTLKSGIFFSGTVNYVPNRQFDNLDGGSVETGYNYEKDNFSAGVTLSKYFAAFNSTQLVSALDATLGAEVSYNINDIVTPSAHVDYALVKSGGNDFILTGGLAHEFTIEKPFAAKDKLSIEPAIHINAGTQNFYNTYYIRQQASLQARINAKSKGKGKGVATTATATLVTPTTTAASKFQVLAYEVSLPFSYSIKKVSAEFLPVYAVAVNKIDDNGTSTFYLPNSSVFYFQVALSYTF